MYSDLKSSQNSLTGSQEVAVVIAMNSCTSTSCLSPDEVMGHVLYNGPYDPQYQTGEEEKPPHQNFTVTVPSSMTSGPVILSVTHLTLVGVSVILGFWNKLHPDLTIVRRDQSPSWSSEMFRSVSSSR